MSTTMARLVAAAAFSGGAMVAIAVWSHSDNREAQDAWWDGLRNGVCAETCGPDAGELAQVIENDPIKCLCRDDRVVHPSHRRGAPNH